MKKLKKLRDSLEYSLVDLKETWISWNDAQKNSSTSTDSSVNSDRIFELVKHMYSLIDKAKEALSAYSKYTAALEKELRKVLNKNDSKRKKKYDKIRRNTT